MPYAGVRAHAKDYNLDEERIGLIGTSAGAHLSMMTAYSEDDRWTDDEELADYSSEVVVDNFGPADLYPMMETDSLDEQEDMPEEIENIKYFVSSDIAEDDIKRKEFLDKYSPIHNIDTNTPPTLVIHGDADEIVPHQQSEDLYEKLRENDVKSDLIIVKDAKHVYQGISEEEKDEIVKSTLEFIEEVGK